MKTNYLLNRLIARFLEVRNALQYEAEFKYLMSFRRFGLVYAFAYAVFSAPLIAIVLIAETFSGKQKIGHPPGSLVIKITELVCSKKTHERVFLQNVLDMREEYYEALAANRGLKARCVLIRGYFSLCLAIALQLGVGVTSRIVKAVIGLGG